MSIKNKLILPGLMALVFCMTISVQADNAIAPSPEQTKPLKAGVRAPDFTVYNVDGTPFHFEADKLERPALIITFRGGWCPYCNTQLQELRNVLPEIKQSGVDVLFLSGDRPEILYSNLKQETQDSINGLDYTILSDADISAGKAFGLAFRVPDETINKYRQRDWDLASSSMDKYKVLSIPAVYVIRANGEIAFAYSEPDYRVRLPAEEVKAAVARVLSESK
jgi:peroxiredoxin